MSAWLFIQSNGESHLVLQGGPCPEWAKPQCQREHRLCPTIKTFQCSRKASRPEHVEHISSNNCHNKIIKPLTVLITTNWKILQEMGLPDHLTCLLRNLYAGQEATVRTGHGTTNWFQIQKEVCQGCILSPCLFNFYAEYILRNAGQDEAQTGIKIARRDIITSEYADDNTLMAVSEELKSFFMKVKEDSEKIGLKLSIQKTKIMASGPITSWQIDGETVETVRNFIS